MFAVPSDILIHTIFGGKMRPPLLSFTTFNRLGSTIESLDSVLKDDSDFEMIILDNNSKDKTRDYLLTLKDNRIKEIKLFDTNIGGIQAVNYALTKRHPEQDFMNLENDVRVLTENFVNKFKDIAIENEAGQVHAAIKGLHDESHFQESRFFKSPVYGAFFFIPAKVMNAIKYYDERTNRADKDLNRRINALPGSGTGYTSNVEIIIIQPDALSGDASFGCDACILKQNVCAEKNKRCLDYYVRLHIKLNEMAYDRKPIEDFDDSNPSTCHIDGIGPDAEWFRNLFQSEYEKGLSERSLT